MPDRTDPHSAGYYTMLVIVPCEQKTTSRPDTIAWAGELIAPYMNRAFDRYYEGYSNPVFATVPRVTFETIQPTIDLPLHIARLVDTLVLPDGSWHPQDDPHWFHQHLDPRILKRERIAHAYWRNAAVLFQYRALANRGVRR